jgi:hypothetical protein
MTELARVGDDPLVFVTMAFDPRALGLQNFFVDPAMFSSTESFRRAGFEVPERGHDLIMVGSHPMVKGYLFKKYKNHIAAKEQHENYLRRIDGARRLRSFIAERQLRHIITPQKWLYDLPPAFTAAGRDPHVLVVEQFQILDEAASIRAYGNIADAVLNELCEVIFRFRGLDSSARNVVFTTRGQIAFIDTENWSRKKKRYFKFIREYLSKKNRKRAKRIFKKLEDA